MRRPYYGYALRPGTFTYRLKVNERAGGVFLPVIRRNLLLLPAR